MILQESHRIFRIPESQSKTLNKLIGGATQSYTKRVSLFRVQENSRGSLYYETWTDGLCNRRDCMIYVPTAPLPPVYTSCGANDDFFKTLQENSRQGSIVNQEVYGHFAGRQDRQLDYSYTVVKYTDHLSGLVLLMVTNESDEDNLSKLRDFDLSALPWLPQGVEVTGDEWYSDFKLTYVETLNRLPYPEHAVTATA